MNIYIVQKGDTLWKIAKKFNINFEQLKKMNQHLANPDYIVPGMELFLPDDHGKKEVPMPRPIPQPKEVPKQTQPQAPSQPQPPRQEVPRMQPMPFPVPMPYPYQVPSPQSNIQMMTNFPQEAPHYHHYFMQPQFMQQPMQPPTQPPMHYPIQPPIPPFEMPARAQMPQLNCGCQRDVVIQQMEPMQCQPVHRCTDKQVMNDLYYDKIAHVQQMCFTGACNPLSKFINRPQ